MPNPTISKALEGWRTSSRSKLDELLKAHHEVGGGGRGRRYATEQINHAYLVAVSAQFQKFCRDLHSEAAAFLVGDTRPESFRPALLKLLTDNRKLDRGNPNPGNIGADFGRFGLDFWAAVRALDRRNERRQDGLEQLNVWRNAIAHQDFTLKDSDAKKVEGTHPQLADVRTWRGFCESLSEAFDAVTAAHLRQVVGRDPW